MCMSSEIETITHRDTIKKVTKTPSTNHSPPPMKREREREREKAINQKNRILTPKKRNKI